MSGSRIATEWVLPERVEVLECEVGDKRMKVVAGGCRMTEVEDKERTSAGRNKAE